MRERVFLNLFYCTTAQRGADEGVGGGGGRGSGQGSMVVVVVEEEGIDEVKNGDSERLA